MLMTLNVIPFIVVLCELWVVFCMCRFGCFGRSTSCRARLGMQRGRYLCANDVGTGASKHGQLLPVQSESGDGHSWVAWPLWPIGCRASQNGRAVSSGVAVSSCPWFYCSIDFHCICIYVYIRKHILVASNTWSGKQFHALPLFPLEHEWNFEVWCSLFTFDVFWVLALWDSPVVFPSIFLSDLFDLFLCYLIQCFLYMSLEKIPPVENG